MIRRVRRMSGGLKVKQAVAFFVVALLSVALGLVSWMFVKKTRMEKQYLSHISELEQEIYQLSAVSYTKEDTEPVKDQEIPRERLMEMEYAFISIPSHIKEGDSVDVRMRFPDGSDFIVVSHKQLLSYDRENGSVVIPVTEEELLMLSSAEADRKMYGGSRIYLSRYTDSVAGDESVPDYVPLDSVIELIKNDPNIINITRTIPESSRESLENRLSGYKNRGDDGEETENYISPESGLPEVYGGSIWD